MTHIERNFRTMMRKSLLSRSLQRRFKWSRLRWKEATLNLVHVMCDDVVAEFSFSGFSLNKIGRWSFMPRSSGLGHEFQLMAIMSPLSILERRRRVVRRTSRVPHDSHVSYSIFWLGTIKGRSLRPHAKRRCYLTQRMRWRSLLARKSICRRERWEMDIKYRGDWGITPWGCRVECQILRFYTGGIYEGGVVVKKGASNPPKY